MVVTELNGTSFDSFVKGSKVAVVDCWAPWCGPCRRMGPEMEKVADALWPNDGWMAYVQKPKDDNAFNYRIKGTPRATADGVFGQVKAKLPSPYAGNNPGIPSDFQYGLVVTRNGATVQLAFRVAKRRESLMSQPLFVSEVRFQGDPEK